MMNSPRPKSGTPIDVKSLSPDEARLFRLYGRIPSQSHHFVRHLQKERKYFDSGDYALSQAGKGNTLDVGAVGSLHPAPQNIPHPSPPPRRSSIVSSPGTSPESVDGGGAGFMAAAAAGMKKKSRFQSDSVQAEGFARMGGSRA
ncbi:camp-regulated phosphoprotein/endosulfine conserved region-domain-containing protein [Podospora didyma]|uniref:mRNA stability protein n=1 Tax=Podospora didyma TaxID=330526 RepID=A0AAE0P3Y0_9PEZI|nr:camp-regulated phosphoprotein/endosulfine conserved region-domain-containing protein [Podospora didyma]